MGHEPVLCLILAAEKRGEARLYRRSVPMVQRWAGASGRGIGLLCFWFK